MRCRVRFPNFKLRFRQNSLGANKSVYSRMNEKELELKYIGLRDDPTECWSVNTRSGDACHSTDPCPAHLDYYKVGGVRIIVFVYLSDLKLVEHFEYCLDS